MLIGTRGVLKSPVVLQCTEQELAPLSNFPQDSTLSPPATDETPRVESPEDAWGGVNWFE